MTNLTPERRAYAEKRIAKLVAANEAILVKLRKSGPDLLPYAEHQRLDKQRRSNNTALRRWYRITSSGIDK